MRITIIQGVEELNMPDKSVDEATTYQSDFEEWVQNGCKKAAEIVNRSEEEK